MKYLETWGVKKERIFMYPFTSITECDILDRLPTDDEKEGLKKKLMPSICPACNISWRLIPVKGFKYLLETASILGEYNFLIVGGVPTIEYLKLMNKYQLSNFYFESFKNKEELWQYYMAADLYAFTTLGDVWGLVINEAMAVDCQLYPPINL